ncbi:hypothetical protein FRC02_006307 [Tulasnella sp. 418]|nr:hypothetical protein FRC02_006307 [Tulasnella sp. 418]
MKLFATATLFTLAAARAFAATADEWRSRSIYQIITDRFALPQGSKVDPSACNPLDQTWCGGTWSSIRENLDYIQDMGFTAIWISPVHHNIEEHTAYGDAYHGYWIDDISKLNPRFGTPDDLKALVKELHRRDMYIMVDIVVNNVVATTTKPDFSKFFFKDAADYHPYCPVEYGNPESEQQCWMGDEKVALVDVNTESDKVVQAYSTWITDFVKEYDIDGLRIDAAKHVRKDFWPGFCGAAGVFCIGEVFGDSIDTAASYQGPLDSVLNFPMYSALREAFAVPGDLNMTGLVSVFDQSKKAFSDLGLLGNFLENHDLPRWSNFSSDPQSKWNAMTFNFMSDGIPIVYYGQEQDFVGIHDPVNREPLWPSGYNKTGTVEVAAKLNQIRNHLIDKSDWLTQKAEIISYSKESLFLAKGYVITVLTNVGSPPANVSASMLNTGFQPYQQMIDIFTCKPIIVGSHGSLYIDYFKGGKPTVLVPEPYIRGTKICSSSDGTANALESKGRANGATRRFGTPRFFSSFVPETLLGLGALFAFLVWDGGKMMLL